jgi:hypothetical protein
MKCLESRTRADGIRTRRYQLEDGRRFTTFELPATVIKAVGLKRVQEFMEKWKRGENQRTESHTRRQRIEALLQEGIKPTAIAHEVGVTETRVRQIRTEMQHGKDQQHERKRKRTAPVQRQPRGVRPQVGGDIRTRWIGGRSPFDI